MAVTLAGKLQVDAVQSVMPSKATKQGQTQPISVLDPLSREIFRQHFRIVYYYNKKQSEDDCGWELGGWLKESLATALSDQPVLAGRLQKRPDSGQRLPGENQELEIKLNDAGIRMIQAQYGTTVAEFLEIAREDDRAEDKLAYWKEIDSYEPQYSALFYIQVTNFHGDGFSIGLCCSLLLADPFTIANFVRTWAQIHMKQQTHNQPPKMPMFHLPNVGKPTRSIILYPTPCDNNSYKTLNFKLGHLDPNKLTQATVKNGTCGDESMQEFGTWDHIESLGSFCFKEAVRVVGARTVPKITMISTNRAGARRVSFWEKGEQFRARNGFSGALVLANWEDFKSNDTIFQGESKPIHVSFRMEPFIGGVVLVSPFTTGGTLGTIVIVTLPQYTTA